VFSTIMKLVSVTTLLLTAMFWRSAANYQLLLELTIFMGALVVAQQAVRAKHYLWTAVFAAIALLFNPVVAVPRPTGDLFLLMIFVCLAPFAFSLVAWKPQPILSIPSITDRTPGSESL
jgi:Family of unknown function (DUF6804)